MSLQVFYLSVSEDIQRLITRVNVASHRAMLGEVPTREALTPSNQRRLCLLQLEINHNHALFVPSVPNGKVESARRWHVAAPRRVYVWSASLCLCRMDDIQLCKEITRLKTELHKLVSVPGSAELMVSAGCLQSMREKKRHK